MAKLKRLTGALVSVALLVPVLGCAGRPARGGSSGAAPVPAPVKAESAASGPTAAEVERIRELVGQLGDEDYAVRQKAAAGLAGLGFKALPFLEAAERSVDPEVANAARGLALKLFWPLDAAEAGRRQRAAAEALGVPVQRTVDLGGGIGLELVLIPAGAFEMGSPDGGRHRMTDEGPVRRVRLTAPFYMGKYEVTQEQWEKVMGKNPADFKAPKNPVERVSWSDCQEFVKKLNASLKGKEEFRLPTEAQWEYACRAGTKTGFSFGDAEKGLDDVAWYQSNSDHKAHPVGQKRANAWGLHDMHGNVWEWCQDRFGTYGGDEQDPGGPAAGPARVVRGGSWFSTADTCRAASRNEPGLGSPPLRFSPNVRTHFVGFRVAMPLSRTP